jgi:hypothetical protein
MHGCIEGILRAAGQRGNSNFAHENGPNSWRRFVDTPAIQRGIVIGLSSALAMDSREVDAWNIERMPMRIVDPGRAGRHNSPSGLGLLGIKDIHASVLWKRSFNVLCARSACIHHNPAIVQA